jgi:hypothetical protein
MKSVLKLIVDGNQTIESIKRDFNKAYPFLKIEFFKDPQVRGVGSEKNKMYQTDWVELRTVQKKSNAGTLLINGERTVQELENEFEQQYGLYIQVFRRSGKVWLATSVTDKWTLDEQNEEAKKFSERIRVERENPDDHDIY